MYDSVLVEAFHKVFGCLLVKMSEAEFLMTSTNAVLRSAALIAPPTSAKVIGASSCELGLPVYCG